MIVFTGAGQAFCAGADLEDLQKTVAKKPVQREPALKSWFKLVWKIKNVELPTIAAVHGAALGLPPRQTKEICCQREFNFPHGQPLTSIKN